MAAGSTAGVFGVFVGMVNAGTCACERFRGWVVLRLCDRTLVRTSITRVLKIKMDRFDRRLYCTALLLDMIRRAAHRG